MKQYIDFITRIARHYTLPAKCAITHDDLVQEGCLGYLEAQIKHPDADEKKLLNYARKAIQCAIIRYSCPVTRSLDTVLYNDDYDNPITLADTIADNSAESDPSIALLDAALTFIESLDTQLAAGTITPANYRPKKHRFLHKLQRQVSQNSDFSVLY